MANVTPDLVKALFVGFGKTLKTAWRKLQANIPKSPPW